MPKTMYFVKQSAEPNTLDLYLYDYIEGDGEDWWTGEKIESETSANYVKEQLEAAGDVTQINVYINSYGGEVKEGLGIYNLLKRHPAQKTVYIDGFACSIASVIAMVGDPIIMANNGLMMIHHASAWADGNAEELRKIANDLEVIDKASCSSYLVKAGDKLDEKTLNKLLDAQTWLNAEDCLKYGLADKIAGIEDNDNISQAKQKFGKYIQLIKKQHQSQKPIQVPKDFVKQKTNAEKLMSAFKKKIEGGNE